MNESFLGAFRPKTERATPLLPGQMTELTTANLRKFNALGELPEPAVVPPAKLPEETKQPPDVGVENAAAKDAAAADNNGNDRSATDLKANTTTDMMLTDGNKTPIEERQVVVEPTTKALKEKERSSTDIGAHLMPFKSLPQRADAGLGLGFFQSGFKKTK